MLTKTTPLEKLDRKLFAKGIVPAVSVNRLPHEALLECQHALAKA